MAHRGEDLYEQHAQLVYRYLFSLCRDADLAEELCQETFCQALRQLGSFRGDCTPQVWLCAIAKRLWYKELERRKRNVPLEEEHLAGQAAPDDPAQETEQREGRLALYRAMQQLDRTPGRSSICGWPVTSPSETSGTSWTGARYGPGSGSTGEKRSWLDHGR